MDNTILLLHCEDFTDSSLTPKTLVNNGASVNENGKFGKGINLNSNQSIKIANCIKDLDLTKDFTIDWWEYSTGTTVRNSCLFTNRFSTNTGYSAGGLLIGYDGKKLYAGEGNGWSGLADVIIKDKIDNVWVHWALVKQGSKWTTYKNGVQFWSTISNVATSNLDDGNCTFGDWASSIGYNAIIDEFRISNVARWSEGFTPPTNEYVPNIPIIDVKYKTSDNINFSVFYDGVINKIEVFVNNIKLQTYISNFDNLNFAIDINNSAYIKGENKIKIVATYDSVKTIDKSVLHNVHILYNASLKEVMDAFEILSNMDLAGNIQKQNLVDKLIAIGVDASISMSFDELLGLMGGISTGIKWASGKSDYITISSPKKRFTHASGSTVQWTYITIPKLDFKPRLIFANWDTTSYHGLHSSVIFNDLVKIGEYNSVWYVSTGSTNEQFKADNIVVTDSAIYLPVNSVNSTYSWIAFE